MLKKSLLSLILLVFSSLLIGCESSSDPEPVSPPPGDDVTKRSFGIGSAGLVPRNYPTEEDDDWLDLQDKIPGYGEWLGMHSGWDEGNLDEDGIPEVFTAVYNQAQLHDLKHYFVVGFEPDAVDPEDLDDYFKDHGEDFKAVCVELAKRYHPRMMFIGIEINRYYELSTVGFSDFIDLYHDIYNAIKNESPETLVGSNFLFEYMLGNAKRSGKTHTPHFYLIDQFSASLDIISFTLFPFLEFDNPNDIPDDYLDIVKDYTSRPIMITETGWPSMPVTLSPELEASEDLQVDYLNKLIYFAENLPLENLIWVWQHDPENDMAGGIFNNISLRKRSGEEKKAFEHWTELKNIPLK